MRRYAQEKPNGTPVEFNRIAVRRKLIGKRIEWNREGFLSKHSGIVQEVNWKNVLVSGNWEWAPDMKNVHVAEDQ